MQKFWALFLILLCIQGRAATQGPEACPQGRTEVSPQTIATLELKPCLSLKYLTLGHTNISDARLGYSHFNSVEFIELTLQKSSFIGTEFTVPKLDKVKVKAVNFENSLWRGGEVKDSRFNESSFNRAVFKGTRWLRSDFSSSSFRETEWSNCFLERINLEDADLRGAQFKNCVLIGVNLRRATFNRNTVLPLTEAQKAQQGMVYQP